MYHIRCCYECSLSVAVLAVAAWRTLGKKRELYSHMEIDVYVPNRVCFIWSPSRTRQKAWPFPSFTILSAYRHDPVAGQISVAQQTDVATNNETLKCLPQYCWDATAVSVLWKLMTGWLMAARSILWARRGFKCREWGCLNEKSVQRTLSSNTWECLWQAFQAEDQYISYHVSHIDHWLSIVIRVPNGKPMLLVLRRHREETNKRGIHNPEQIHFKPFKCVKGASVCRQIRSKYHLYCV